MQPVGGWRSFGDTTGSTRTAALFLGDETTGTRWLGRPGDYNKRAVCGGGRWDHKRCDASWPEQQDAKAQRLTPDSAADFLWPWHMGNATTQKQGTTS